MIPVLEARSYTGRFQKAELFNPKHFLGVRNITIQKYQESIKTLEKAISQVASDRRSIASQKPYKIIGQLEKSTVYLIFSCRISSLSYFLDLDGIVDTYNLLCEKGELALLKQPDAQFYEALRSMRMGYLGSRTREYIRQLADGDLHKLALKVSKDALNDAEEIHQWIKQKMQEERDEYTSLEPGSVEKLSRSTIRPGNFKFIQDSSLRKVLCFAFNSFRKDPDGWHFYFVKYPFQFLYSLEIHHFFEMIKKRIPTLESSLIGFIRTIAKEPDLDEYWNTLLEKHLAHKHSFKSAHDELHYYLRPIEKKFIESEKLLRE